MKSKEDKDSLKQRLAPYSKMNGENLLETYCDSAELQNEFPLFYDFIFNIRKHYKDSPLHQEEVWVSLLKIRDTTIEALIYQRRDARETTKEKMPCYIKQTQKIAEALARECNKSWYNNMKEWKSRCVKETYLKLKKHIDRVDSIIYGNADTLDMLEEYLEFHGKAPLAKRIKDERNWYSKWAWQVSPEPIYPGFPNATPHETLYEFACTLELAVRKLAQTLAHVVNLTKMNATARDKAGDMNKPQGKGGQSSGDKMRDTIQTTPKTDSALIYQADAATFYNIPKSTLSKAGSKKPGEPGYLWTGRKGKRVFYRKSDCNKLAKSRTKLRNV